MKAVLIRSRSRNASKTCEEVEIENDGEINSFVGGIPGVVRFGGKLKLPQSAIPIVMLVDEEGLMKGRELNPVASVMYGTDKHGHPIVGDVLLLGELPSNEGGREFVAFPGTVDQARTLIRGILQGAPS